MLEKIVKGIILEKYIFEDEHIIKLLSEGGNIVSLKAKGLHKHESKNRMSLNSFNIVEVEYFCGTKNSNTGRLKRATVKKEFLSDNDLSLNVTSVIRGVILNVDGHSKVIFETVCNILNCLENNLFSFQNILSLLILVLRSEGYRPSIDRCVSCGSNQEIKGFSLYVGGLICDKHKESQKYEMDRTTLRKIIEINSLVNPDECRFLDLSPQETKQLKSMYKLFFENQLGISLFYIERI